MVEQAGTLNWADRIAITLDRDRSGNDLITPLAVFTGIGAGVVTYKTIEEGFFPRHHEYDRVQSQLRPVEEEYHSLVDATKVLVRAGLVDASEQAAAKARQDQVRITEIRQRLPANYRPALESSAATLGALVIGSVTYLSLLIAVRRRAQRANSRKLEA